MSTTLTNTLESLNLRGDAPLKPIVAPLVPTGALSADKFPREYLTPAIGAQFGKQVKLKEILSLPKEERDAVLKDLAVEISHWGVVFFQDQNELVPTDLATLATLLGELSGKPKESTLHIHPTQELDESGLPLGKIDNKPTKDGRQISFPDAGLISKGWHTDVAFEPFPAEYTILKMHTLPPTGGDTLWQSQYATYDKLSPTLKKTLEGLHAVHDAHRFREQSRNGGYSLRTDPRGHPDNSGDEFRAIHPLIRTNPVTGLKALYVQPTFTKRIVELTEDESDAVLQYLFKLQNQSVDLMVKYRWSKDDVAIWDDRSTNHLATFDYTEPRQGDRAVVVGEKPYYDPASIGRDEYLRQQATASA